MTAFEMASSAGFWRGWIPESGLPGFRRGIHFASGKNCKHLNLSQNSGLNRKGGFQVDSPVKKPRASEMPRSAPPYTFGGWEEPCQGGMAEKRVPKGATSARKSLKNLSANQKDFGYQTVVTKDLTNPHVQEARSSTRPVSTANEVISDPASPQIDPNGSAQRNEPARARSRIQDTAEVSSPVPN